MVSVDGCSPAPSDALVAFVRFLTTTRLVAVSQCPGVNTLRWAATMRGRADSAQVDTHALSPQKDAAVCGVAPTVFRAINDSLMRLRVYTQAQDDAQ